MTDTEPTPPLSETDRRIQFIRDNLNSRVDWRRDDYVDFYERDVAFLLAQVTELRGIIDGLSARVSAQAELLGKRGEKCQ